MIAHSSIDEIPVQPYEDHVLGVKTLCEIKLEKIKSHLSTDDFIFLRAIVLNAAHYHDLGKLCDNCQKILNGNFYDKMPNHVDAGTALYLNLKNTIPALLVNAHHRGLKNLGSDLRDYSNIAERCKYLQPERMSDYTDRILDLMLQRSEKCCGPFQPLEHQYDYKKLNANLVRLALSVLVSSDHEDTARNYGNEIPDEFIPLKAEQRLEKLKQHVSTLESSQRDDLRKALFEECLNAKINKFNYCSASVGSGKTLSTLAFALRDNPSKIIYTSPYISITNQNTNVFRKVILDGETPEKIVGENHSQIKSKDSYKERKLANTWKNPIVCTTHVQFIETLSSNHPSRLNKFYSLAGSHIIIDECQSIPIPLWPIILKNLDFLVEKMSCKVTFATGTMSYPWDNQNIKNIYELKHKVHPIVSQELSEKLQDQENKRLSIHLLGGFLDLEQIVNQIKSKDTSVLVVMNTVHNAALVARELSKTNDVLHLSTALCPKDRRKILDNVKLKLNNKEKFILVATSCVECGVDISFENGFRELNGIDEIIQTSGRVNRNLEFKNSNLYVFETLKKDLGEFNILLSANSQSEYTKKLYEKKGTLSAYMCEYAFNKKARLPLDVKYGDTKITIEQLIELENKKKFEDVEKYVRVINDDTCSILLDESIIQGIDLKRDLNKIRHAVLENSITVRRDKINKLPVKEIDGFYIWTGRYSNFLGYQEHFLS